MKIILRKLTKFHSFYLPKGIEFIMVTLLGCMVVLSLAQVLMRYLFNSPFTWSEELVRFLFVWSIFLGGSLAMAKDIHLRAGVSITKHLPTKIRSLIKFLLSICICAVLVILIWKGIEFLELTKNRISTALRIPMYYVWSSVPVNATVMLYFFSVSQITKYFPNIADFSARE
jgi:TRAP-type transport system small permease protein